MRIHLATLVVTAMFAILGSSLQAQDPVTIDVFTEGGFPFDFTSDGRYIAVVSYTYPFGRDPNTFPDTFVNVYQVSDFSLVASYDIPKEETEFVAISHDAKLIAYVQSGGLYVLDTETGETTQETFNFYEFEELEFNPVNNLLAYVIGRGITVFDPTNPAFHHELLDNVYGGTIASLAWSPDGRYLANGVYRAGSQTFDVLVWDIPTLQNPIEEAPSFALEGAKPNHIAWRDPETLASFGAGGVSVFDVPTRSLTVFIPNPSNLVWSEGVWSPDGTQLLASGENENDAVIQIWNVSNLPAYESIFYQEGVIGTNPNWTNFGLFYSSQNLHRDGEFLVPQLTATALGTPVMPSALTPTATPVGFVPSVVPSRTPIPPSLTPIPTDRPAFPDNLLLNGGFENSEIGSDIPIYWYGTGLTSDDRQECNDIPAEGQCLFRFSSSSPSSTPRTLLQRFFISTELIAGDRLSLSGQFSSDNLVGGGVASVQILYINGGVSSIFLPIPSGTFGYITLTEEVLIEDNFVIQIDISIELPGESTGVLRVDDLRLTHTDFRLVTPEVPLPTETPSRTPTATPTATP